jgi:hypothetical protein
MGECRNVTLDRRELADFTADGNAWHAFGWLAVNAALHQKSKLNALSAKGAKYESQGQAAERSEARRPWTRVVETESTESAKYEWQRQVIALFQSWENLSHLPRGDALRFAQRLPLAFIFRAFGAQRRRLRLLRQSRLTRSSARRKLLK